MFPARCPACEAELAPAKDEDVDYRCPNAESCPDQLAERVAHIGSRGALDVEGLGDEGADALTRPDRRKVAEDLYSDVLPRPDEINRDKDTGARVVYNDLGEPQPQVPVLRNEAGLFGLTIDDLQDVYRWREDRDWVPPTDEEKAVGKKGHWEKNGLWVPILLLERSQVFGERRVGGLVSPRTGRAFSAGAAGSQEEGAAAVAGAGGAVHPACGSHRLPRPGPGLRLHGEDAQRL